VSAKTRGRELNELGAVVTAAEAAELLGVTAVRIHQLVDAGAILGRRASTGRGERGTLLVLRSSAEAYRPKLRRRGAA
jgi:predicted nucleotidyltransferase